MNCYVQELPQEMAVQVKMSAFHVALTTMETCAMDSVQLNAKTTKSNAHKPHLMDVPFQLCVTQNQLMSTVNSVSTNNAR